jgi:hypothetical protein
MLDERSVSTEQVHDGKASSGDTVKRKPQQRQNARAAATDDDDFLCGRRAWSTFNITLDSFEVRRSVLDARQLSSVARSMTPYTRSRCRGARQRHGTGSQLPVFLHAVRLAPHCAIAALCAARTAMRCCACSHQQWCVSSDLQSLRASMKCADSIACMRADQSRRLC